MQNISILPRSVSYVFLLVVTAGWLTGCSQSETPTAKSWQFAEDPGADVRSDASPDTAIEPDSDAGQDVLCDTSPSKPDVPFARVRSAQSGSGPILHWKKRGRCITPTFDQGASGIRDELVHALEAWTELPCARVCVKELRQRDNFLDASEDSRVIHFKAARTPGGVPLTDVTFEKSGLIRSAVIKIPRTWVVSTKSDRQTLRRKWLTKAVGHAFGLDHDVPADVSSVMGHADEAAQPTSADEEAFCSVYGRSKKCRN